MTTTTTTTTTPATYAPDAEVIIDQRPLPAVLRTALTGVRFEEAFEGADRVELQFADPRGTVLDDPVLRLDAPLALSLGYRPGALTEVFTGSVTGVETSFPASGMPSVTVVAQDAMQQLTQGNKQRGFPWYLTDTVIAGIIAAENRLLIATDAITAVLGGAALLDEVPRFQHQQSDHALLRQIAAQYGFDMWVEGDRLNFRTLLRGMPSSDLRLHRGESLLDFTPRLSSIGQVAAVGFRLWVRRLKLQLAVSVGYDGDRLTAQVALGASAGGGPGTAGDPAGASLTLPAHVLDEPAEAIRYAIGELRRRINTRTTGSGSAVGDPRLRVGEVISLTGIGSRFSGDDYRITSVAHTFDSGGYRTAFSVRREVV